MYQDKYFKKYNKSKLTKPIPKALHNSEVREMRQNDYSGYFHESGTLNYYNNDGKRLFAITIFKQSSFWKKKFFFDKNLLNKSWGRDVVALN